MRELLGQSLRNILKPTRDNRGVALLVAIFSVIFIAFLATEVSYDTSTEYLIASEEISRIKAYHAAKAGVAISLLRIQIYQQVVKQFGKEMGGAQMLDQVWKFPFAWPPVLPDEISRVDKEQIQSVVGESIFEGEYAATISSESSKIDLNDLASRSKTLVETTKKQLVRLLENKIQNDADFAERNRDLRPEELVNNMIDWVDPNEEGLNSGDERSLYADLKVEGIPPNQPFKTLDELHMVAGMNDEIFNYLRPQVTVYGIKGIQVNYASEDILRSLDPQITEEVAKEIIKRRDDPQQGIFKDEKDFLGFIQGLGVDPNNFNKDKIPLIFDAEYNFRISSIGRAGRSTREIIAIVYDFDKVKERLGDIVKKEQEAEKTQQGPGTGGPTPTPSPSPGPNSQQPGASKGKPQIVYWHED